MRFRALQTIMSSQTEGPWAQLVSTTDIDTPPTPIHEDKFTIGRNPDCGISHAGNKLVSGNHCFIERDKCGKVWLYDTSRNGTLFNLKIKLGKGECRELSHGDEFHLVHKKDNTDDDIGYLFQDLKALEAETSSEFDETQEYDYNLTIPDTNSTVTDEDANIVTAGCPVEKRKAAEKESSTGNKKLKLDEENPGVASKAGDSSSSPSSTSEGQITRKADNRPGPSNTGNLSGHNSGQVKESKEDVIAETLVCIICHELLHDCISLQPCLHSFCSGCYSEWMELSQECPSCRLKVERINKNHIINNLVEAYLKVNPDKKRPDEDIQLLETKNKITRDMLYPPNKVTSSLEGSDTLYETGSSENNDDYDDENEDNSDDSGDGGANFGGVNFNPFTVNPFGVPYFAAHRGRPAARPVCRQCPDYNPATDPTAFIAAAQAGPSADPDAKKFPTAPLFQCKQRADHVLCLCCLQPMPDRRKEFNFRPDCSVPPQQCSLCYRSFCHAYWGCRKADCDGCLAKLKDLNFGRGCLNFLILDNAFESSVFKSYLEAKNLSVKDVLGVCLARMVNRQYTCTDQARLESQNGINTPVCYACGLRNFKDLAFAYRRDIANDQLPATITCRPDCHWGKNCRTQKSKPEHAKRYNHICEQTRIA